MVKCQKEDLFDKSLKFNFDHGTIMDSPCLFTLVPLKKMSKCKLNFCVALVTELWPSHYHFPPARVYNGIQ